MTNLSIRHQQARKIAFKLKDNSFVKSYRKNDKDFIFGIVLNDKLVKITMNWSNIDVLSVGELEEFILKQME